MADTKQQGGAAPQASDLVEETQSAAAKVADAAQEKARGLAAAAEQKARQLAEEKKRQAGEQVEGFAKVAESVAEQVERALPPAGGYVRGVADQIHSISSALQDRSIDDLMDEARRFAQQRPATVLAGALIAGFGLARFLKASADRRSHERMRQAPARRTPQRRGEASRPEYPSDVAVEGAPTARASQSMGSTAGQGRSSDGR
jgi:hypothetical protein